MDTSTSKSKQLHATVLKFNILLQNFNEKGRRRR